MRYEVRPCVGEKVEYYIVRHKWWWTEPLLAYHSPISGQHFGFVIGDVAYFDTAQEAKQKAIELFGTTARIDVKTVRL